MDALLVVQKVWNRWDLELLGRIAENQRLQKEYTVMLASGEEVIAILSTELRIAELKHQYQPLVYSRQMWYTDFCLTLPLLSPKLAGGPQGKPEQCPRKPV